MELEHYNESFLEFLGQATSPFHAVRAMGQQLADAGFTRLREGQEWSTVAGQGYFLTRNDSAIIAFRHGASTGPESGLRMAGAHTDSPCLMVKPNPEKSCEGYRQLGVEVYGAALLNPWFDRDLSLAGRVSYIDNGGALCKQLVDFRRPLAVIPSLAIHLDRKANESRGINAQTDIVPVLGNADGLDIRELLARQLLAEYPGIGIGEVLDYELCCYDTQPARQIGLEGEFIAAARLDNLLSCYAGLRAIIDSDGEYSSLLVCNDHEEVGSQSAAGAQGPFLQSVLRQLCPEMWQYNAMIEASCMISVDNAHAVHPNFAGRHDDKHGPRLNGGPVIKSNANQRYASSSETAALFRGLCRDLGIPVQTYVVRSDMACGSTIGPLTATEIGVRTLDVGAPQLAMHSIRELTGSIDPWRLATVLRVFMNRAQPLRAKAEDW
ncbi:MAG: M18 family aminopeptidase [Halieaceae bacterium]|nr:M18 family aminopeptidase [Halieaceae bacterium]